MKKHVSAVIGIETFNEAEIEALVHLVDIGTSALKIYGIGSPRDSCEGGFLILLPEYEERLCGYNHKPKCRGCGSTGEMCTLNSTIPKRVLAVVHRAILERVNSLKLDPYERPEEIQ